MLQSAVKPQKFGLVVAAVLLLLLKIVLRAAWLFVGEEGGCFG